MYKNKYNTVKAFFQWKGVLGRLICCLNEQYCLNAHFFYNQTNKLSLFTTSAPRIFSFITLSNRLKAYDLKQRMKMLQAMLFVLLYSVQNLYIQALTGHEYHANQIRQNFQNKYLHRG